MQLTEAEAAFRIEKSDLCIRPIWTILEELRRIQSVDVVLPVEDGREMRIRCVVRPDEARETLLNRLGLRLPRRLRAASVLPANP